MPYTAEKPTRASDSAELRASIPGWGADLDPADRPSVPRERPYDTGAHWDFPEAQAEVVPRERSIEHAMLTPVFGTVAPLKGLSGVIRRYSYANLSEGRAAHWLLLIAADRVDAAESHLRSFASRRPDNPFTETGLRGEFSGHGLRSRVGRGRVDGKHMWMDPIIVAGPWVIAAAGIALLVRRAVRR